MEDRCSPRQVKWTWSTLAAANAGPAALAALNVYLSASGAGSALVWVSAACFDPLTGPAKIEPSCSGSGMTNRNHPTYGSLFAVIHPRPRSLHPL